VWQFFDPAKRPAINRARLPWREALDLPGANQMQHLRAMADQRPQDVGGPWNSIYLAAGTEVAFHRERPYRVTLLNPRTGAMTDLGVSTACHEFRAPLPADDGPDWVVVLDDAAAA
jgi:hypothetical protein